MLAVTSESDQTLPFASLSWELSSFSHGRLSVVAVADRSCSSSWESVSAVASCGAAAAAVVALVVWISDLGLAGVTFLPCVVWVMVLIEVDDAEEDAGFS